ncbi:MAG: sulfatase [Rubrobacter sp.]|nr:sulfatase [Rubrobacter sp.]
MPNLTSLLADQGTTFENAFVTLSLCCPARASILRGQYPHNHQVLTNGGPPYYDNGQARNGGPFGFNKFHRMGHEESNVATWLKSAGYKTVLIGKYLNGYPKEPNSETYPEGIKPTYIPPGWDEWYGHIEEGTKKGLYYNYRINENGEIVSYGNDEADYNTDVLVGKATEYIGRTANDPQPFFMYLATNAPHDPFTPAPRHKEEFAGTKAMRLPSFNEKDVSDKPSWLRNHHPLYSAAKIEQVDKLYRARLQMLLAVDEMISGLIGALEASGKLDNTYIVFTSDHGYHLGEHRRQGKESAYEEDIRVPLIVRGPSVSPGRVLDQFVLNIDFAPTFAELAEVSAPDFIDGNSLVPLLTGGTPPTGWRSAFLFEHWNESAQQWMIPDYKGVRTSEHVYVEHGTGDYELYGLLIDPYELQNIYDTADSTLVSQLKSQLERWSDCGGEVCRSAM